METIYSEMSNPVFWENKKIITNLLSAENFTQIVVQVKKESIIFTLNFHYKQSSVNRVDPDYRPGSAKGIILTVLFKHTAR